MIGKIYKIAKEPILLFNEVDFDPPKELMFEFVGYGSPQENPDMPCFHYPQFFAGILGKRSVERVLDTEGIRTWRDLCALEIAIKHKVCAKSARIRAMVLEKYNIINDSEFEKHESEQTKPAESSDSVSDDTGAKQ